MIQASKTQSASSTPINPSPDYLTFLYQSGTIELRFNMFSPDVGRHIGQAGTAEHFRRLPLPHLPNFRPRNPLRSADNPQTQVRTVRQNLQEIFAQSAGDGGFEIKPDEQFVSRVIPAKSAA